MSGDWILTINEHSQVHAICTQTTVEGSWSEIKERKLLSSAIRLVSNQWIALNHWGTPSQSIPMIYSRMDSTHQVND